MGSFPHCPVAVGHVMSDLGSGTTVLLRMAVVSFIVKEKTLVCYDSTFMLKLSTSKIITIRAGASSANTPLFRAALLGCGNWKINADPVASETEGSSKDNNHIQPQHLWGSVDLSI